MEIIMFILLILVGSMFGLGLYLGWLAAKPLYEQRIRELEGKMVEQRLKRLEDRIDKLEKSVQ